ncbi:hypothetical protein HG531_002930 [Fusarium graminearum]|nr:hypothetical protein HG531_002930 [Fusarium graminearum]
MDKVEAVTDNDKRKLLRQLSFLEEILDLLRVVDGAITAQSLNLVELSHLGRGFNVLEVDIRVFRKIHDTAKIIKETLSSLVLLEEINQTNRSHIKTIEGLLNRELTKECGEPLRVEVWLTRDVNNNPLDGLWVLIKLQRLLGKVSLLAKLSDASLVETGVLGLVLLQCIQQEGGGLLNHALSLEDIAHTLEVDQWALLTVSKGTGKLSTLLGVDTGDMLEQLDVIRLEAALGRVRKDLVELTSLSEASNDLLGNLRLKVDCQGHVDIVRPNHVTKLLRAVQLALLQPLLKQMLAVLLENGLCKLEGLMLVKGALVEKHSEVLKCESHLARLNRQALELLDSLGASEETSRRVGSDLSSSQVVARVEELLELSSVQVIGTRKSGSRGHLDSHIGVGGVL